MPDVGGIIATTTPVVGSLVSWFLPTVLWIAGFAIFGAVATYILGLPERIFGDGHKLAGYSQEDATYGLPVYRRKKTGELYYRTKDIEDL